MDAFAELNEALMGGRLERAGELCAELLKAAPDSVELLSLSGALARQKGAHERALDFFTRAAAVNPAVPELHNNVAVVLEDLGRRQEAVDRYRAAIALKPDYCEATSNLGNVLRTMGRSEEAISAYRAAIAIDPAYIDAHYNLGNALRAEGRWREAVESYQNLLAVKPDHLSGWINLGGSLLALNQSAQAMEALRRAIGIDAESPDAHWNLALALLSAGDFENGWREYEWRLKNPAVPFSTTFAGRAMWDGSPLGDKTLLLRSEQGFGDALQFYRYLPLLERRGIKVVLECRRELLPLFAAQNPAIDCYCAGEDPPPFHAFSYLMSLPFLFGTTLSTIPAEVPYLAADPALTSLWGARMQGAGSLKAAVVWAGSAGYQNDSYRSLPLHLLEPLSRVPGMELFSLQMGEASGDLAKEPWAAAVRDLSAGVRDFADTAAIIANLDLVISVDTAVAHLAGAMGKPVLLMLPAASDWRWLNGRSDSPWYPSVRLYRQERLGDWEGVIAAIVKDLAPEPAELNRLFREANALRRDGRLPEAITAYRRLLALRPEIAEIHNNLGLALQDHGELDQAADSYRRALALRPDLADAHNNLGTVLVSQGDREGAVPRFEDAIALRGDYVAAYINLGCCLQNLERPEEALPLYRRAIALQPASVEARVNLGTAYQELMRPEKAVEVYEEALRIDPRHPQLHWNLALSLLSLGHFERGWREYEWRFDSAPTSGVASASTRQAHIADTARWEGERGGGRTILLECEQGLGDTLQFARYARLVAERGLRVVLRCQYPSLKPLLERSPGVSGVFARGEILPHFDCHAPLLSLPRIFATRLETVPAAVPYLVPDPERVALWRSRVAAGDGMKVGLVWRGGPLPKNRACPFENFAPLAAVAGVTFYSMQLGESPDSAVLPALDLAAGITDFADTAAIIANLDLVITVDTAMAHLAGGMGAPVWTMLPYAGDWRWMIGRDDSPWYPSMRIFRQERPGDWQGVMERIKKALGGAVASSCIKR